LFDNKILLSNEMPKPIGLYYIADCIDNSTDLVTNLDKEEWFPVNPNSNVGRKVQHYGFYYDYTTKRIDNPAPPMPPFILELRDILMNKCIELGLTKKYPSLKFDQCIINNYECGEGINAHTDHKDFGSVIGCFTLNSGAILKFTRKGFEPYEIYTKPNSLYIMSSNARRLWSHEMPHKKIDMIDNSLIPGAKKVAIRGRRISVTFRQVKQ
jgi:alkylated DNA repair dioxygenase AlkB